MILFILKMIKYKIISQHLKIEITKNVINSEKTCFLDKEMAKIEEKVKVQENIESFK